jgi:hypothetical protein
MLIVTSILIGIFVPVIIIALSVIGTAFIDYLKGDKK